MPLGCRALPAGSGRARVLRAVDGDLNDGVQQRRRVTTVGLPGTDHLPDDVADYRTSISTIRAARSAAVVDFVRDGLDEPRTSCRNVSETIWT